MEWWNPQILSKLVQAIVAMAAIRNSITDFLIQPIFGPRHSTVRKKGQEIK